MAIKKPTRTLDELRKGMTAFQRKLLQEIWRHFQTKGEWPNLRTLFSDRGKAKVKVALMPLGGSVVREETGSQGWSRCQLSLLGVLLTNDGPALQALMASFFRFQRELYQKESGKFTATSAEIAAALDLSAEQTALLGQLLWLGGLGGSQNRENGSWTVNTMEEAEDWLRAHPGLG